MAAPQGGEDLTERQKLCPAPAMEIEISHVLKCKLSCVSGKVDIVQLQQLHAHVRVEGMKDT